MWSLVPPLASGLERLLAARLTLLLWTAVAVVASDHLARRLGLAPLPRAAALVAIALALGDLATLELAPDVILGGCLLGYAACALHPDVLRDRRRALLAGVWAGVAYLAKSYALPFVLLHLPLTLVVRWLGARRGPPAGRLDRRDLLLSLAAGVAGVFFVALPWIAALSWRHERPTWSTVGRIAHAAVGPHVPPGIAHHPLEGLRAPPPPHRSVWERPEVLPYSDWSPFDSRAMATHQGRLIEVNALKIQEHLASWDLTGLTLLALLLAPLAAWLARRRLPPGAPPALLEWSVWVPATVALHVSGYLLVYVEERYLRTFLLPPVLLLLVGGAGTLGHALGARVGPGGAQRLKLALTLLVCASFALPPLLQLRQRALQPRRRVEARQELLGHLARLELPGPVALVRGHRTYGGFFSDGQELAFLMDRTFVGTCLLPDPRAMARLDELGARTLLALRSADTPVELGPQWVLRATLPAPLFREAAHVDLFVRR